MQLKGWFITKNKSPFLLLFDVYFVIYNTINCTKMNFFMQKVNFLIKKFGSIKNNAYFCTIKQNK